MSTQILNKVHTNTHLLFFKPLFFVQSGFFRLTFNQFSYFCNLQLPAPRHSLLVPRVRVIVSISELVALRH